MSVDYQASGPGASPTSPGSPGPRLNFSEDSKVILGDSGEDAFAYVHHVTLYDLEARGMVRPFCIAYVCSDQMKLMENFSELLTCLSRASDSLKTGNRQAFSMELQRKLQELEYTRMTLLQEANRPNVENGLAGAAAESKEKEKADELEAVEHLISNHRDLLRQVTSYPNRKLKQPDFLPYDIADSLTDPLLPPEACQSLYSSASTSCRSEQRLKPLHELCNGYFLSLMKEQLMDTEHRLRGDRSVLRTDRVTHALSRRLTLVNFLFELWSPEDGDEEESAEAGTGTSVELLRSEPSNMELFLSCVEELPIKLDTEAETGTPEVAMEMTGSVSSSDSIEVLGTEKSYSTQQVNAAAQSRAETPAGLTDSNSTRAAADGGVRQARACTRRANSEDSIEVLSTTESIFPDDLAAITEEEADHQPQTNGLDKQAEVLTEDESQRVDKEKTFTLGHKDESEEEDGRLDTDESLNQNPLDGELLMKEEQVLTFLKNSGVDEDKPVEMLQGKEALQGTPPLSEVHQTGQAVQAVPDLLVHFAPAVTLDEVDQWCPPSSFTRLLSIDEASDHTSSTDLPSHTQNIHSNSRLERKRRRRRAGLRALRFLRQFSFSQHAVFCLLTGRPLVVIGGEESFVRKMVDALSVFLPAPGPDKSGLMLCLTTPLQLVDLLSWRLIGIHRSQTGSSDSVLHSLTRYSRYLALLDLDQKTLHAPSYTGSLVHRLANPCSGIRRGFTFLLHLESCLTALTSQALLCTFRPASEHSQTSGGRNATDTEDFLLTQGFCSSENDLSVMRFLSDLIKQHHAGCGPPSLRFSYCSAQLHRNTHTT